MFQIGHSELIFLLWIFRTYSLPGLGAAPFGDLSNEQIVASLSTAEQSLRARGLISRDPAGGKINLSASLFQLLGTCILAEQTIGMVTERAAGQREIRHFYHKNGLWVIQESEEPGVYRFRLAGDSEALLDELLHLMDLDENAVQSEIKHSIQVSRQTYSKLSSQNLDSSEATSGQAVLLAEGVSPADAGSLIEALNTLRAKTILGAKEQSDDSDRYFILCDSQKGIWTIDTNEENSHVVITPLLLAELREALASFLAFNWVTSGEAA